MPYLEVLSLVGGAGRMVNYEAIRPRVRSMKRVEAAHRYDVAVERGFAFITDTANWSKYWPGYVRLEEGSVGEPLATPPG